MWGADYPEGLNFVIFTDVKKVREYNAFIVKILIPPHDLLVASVNDDVSLKL